MLGERGVNGLAFGLNSLAFGFKVDFLKAVVILSTTGSDEDCCTVEVF